MLATAVLATLAASSASAATTLTVTSCADSGTGSLRSAIATANGDSGDTIQFSSSLGCPVITDRALTRNRPEARSLLRWLR